jgi:hypothetical protein
VAAGGPLGPVQLDELFGMGMEEAGQAGAVAAGALDRPHPSTVVSVGELQQLLVAGRVAGTVSCSIIAPVVAATTAAVWVCLWVSTPMTSSTRSASMAIALTPCPEATWTGRSGPDARQDGDGTHPLASGGQAPDQASSAGSGPLRQPWADKSAQDTTRVSHSKGHAHSHRPQPGSSPNRGQPHSHSTRPY